MTFPVGVNTNGLSGVNSTNEVGGAQQSAANPELGNVKKPSAWAIFGRVMLAVVTLGISEGIRAIVKSCRSNSPNEPHIARNQSQELRSRASKDTYNQVFNTYRNKPGLSMVDIKAFAEPLKLGASRYIKKGIEKDGAGFNFDACYGQYKKLSDRAAEFFSQKRLFDRPLAKYMESGNITSEGLDRVMVMLATLEEKVEDGSITKADGDRVCNSLVNDRGEINDTEYNTLVGE